MADEKLNTVDVGLLVLRLGLGVCCVLHAIPPMAEGLRGWTHVGQAMGVVGITCAPTAWGGVAVLAGLIGGVLLGVGVLVRAIAVILAVTAYVAAVVHFSLGANFHEASQAIELLTAFVALMIMGAGRLSLAHRIGWRWLK